MSDNQELMAEFNRVWTETNARLKKQETELRRVTAVDRSEVTGAVQYFDTVGELPSVVAFAGAVASVDGILYQHDGTAWRQYMPISVGLTGAVLSPVNGMLNVDPTNNRMSYYNGGWIGLKRTDE